MSRVLIIDGDDFLRISITNYFISRGIESVEIVKDDNLASCLNETHTDLVIIDLQSARYGGTELLLNLRSHVQSPAIIATGSTADETERVVALELGADDYITKPYGLRELLARSQAVLRRRRVIQPTPPCARGRKGYQFGAWRLGRHSRRLTHTDGTVVPLSNSDYTLLVAFLDAPQRVLSCRYLIQATRLHEDISPGAVYVQVLRLRRKLEVGVDAPVLIRTERGLGYVFTSTVKPL